MNKNTTYCWYSSVCEYERNNRGIDNVCDKMRMMVIVVSPRIGLVETASSQLQPFVRLFDHFKHLADGYGFVCKIIISFFC